MAGWEAVAHAVLLAVVTLTPLLFLYPSHDAFESVKTTLLGVSALALVVLGVAGCGGSLRGVGADLRWLVRCPIGLAVSCGAVTATLATCLSISPRTSLFGLAYSHAGLATFLPTAVLFYASRVVHRDARRCRQTLAGVAIALAIATAYAMIQGFGLDPFPWENASAYQSWVRPPGTFGHPIWLAGYLVMAVPLVGYLVWVSGQESRRYAVTAGIVGTVLALAVLVMTLSRGAWVAAVSAGGLLLIASGARLRGRWVLGVGTGLTGVAAGVLAMAWMWPEGFAASLVGRVARVGESSARWQVWAAARQAFLDRPWTGHGPDTFGLLFPRYRTPAYWQLEWNHIAVRAHNDFLEALVTQGVFGGLAYLILPLAILYVAYRAWRRGTNPALVGVLAASVLAYYVQNLSGFAMSSCLSLFMVAAGMISRLSEERAAERDSPSPGWIQGMLPGLVALIVLLFVANLYAADQGLIALRPLALMGSIVAVAVGARVLGRDSSDQRDGRLKLDWSGRWRLALAAGAVTPVAWGLVAPLAASWHAWHGEQQPAPSAAATTERYRRAVALAPHLDQHWRGLSAGLLREVQERPDARGNRSRLDEAEAAARHACELVPEQAENHVALARVLRERRHANEQAESPLAAYARALKLDPHNSIYLAEAGIAAVAVGAEECAERYLSRGMAIDPTLGELLVGNAALAIRRERWDEALDWLKVARSGCRWATMPETMSKLRLLDAYAYLRTNRFADAVKVTDKELSERPGNRAAQAMRQQALRALATSGGGR